MKHAFSSGLKVPSLVAIVVGPRRGRVDISGNKGGERWAEAYKALEENDGVHC